MKIAMTFKAKIMMLAVLCLVGPTHGQEAKVEEKPDVEEGEKVSGTVS